MKSLIFFLAITFFSICISACKTKTPDGKDSETVATGSATYYSVSAIDYYTNGMHYKVFNSANGNLYVVNITLDSLQLNKK